MVLRQERAKSRSLVVYVVLVILLAVPLSAGVVLLKNEGHANEYHDTAQSVRDKVSKKCEIWYSANRGTTLELCDMGGNQMGGRIVRLATSTGELYGEKSYECTAFAAKKSYWRHVITRDGYMPAPQKILTALKACNGGKYGN